MAEHRIVVPGVVGSSPITHPIKNRGYQMVSSVFYMGFWGNGTRKAGLTEGKAKSVRWTLFRPWESPMRRSLIKNQAPNGILCFLYGHLWVMGLERSALPKGRLWRATNGRPYRHNPTFLNGYVGAGIARPQCLPSVHAVELAVLQRGAAVPVFERLDEMGHGGIAQHIGDFQHRDIAVLQIGPRPA